MNRRTDAWQNGRFTKMDDNLVHTPPKHQPPKMDVLPNKILQIILAAKWLVQHSSTSPKQQRRPLYSLLSDSSSMVEWQVMQLAGHPLPIVTSMFHIY